MLVCVSNVKVCPAVIADLDLLIYAIVLHLSVDSMGPCELFNGCFIAIKKDLGQHESEVVVVGTLIEPQAFDLRGELCQEWDLAGAQLDSGLLRLHPPVVTEGETLVRVR